MINFSRFKKPLMIIGFIILVGVIAYLIWLSFFKEQPGIIPPGEQVGTSTSPGGLPSVEPGEGGDTGELTGPGRLPGDDGAQDGEDIDTPIGQIDPDAYRPTDTAQGQVTRTRPIVQSQTLNPSLSGNSINYYNKEDGYFYKLDRNGNVVKLSDKKFYNVEDVTWAPNTDKAIIEYPDGNKISYDFNSEKQVTLPSYWEDFSFSQNGDEIVAKSMGLDENNRWLIVSNSDGSQATAIESIGDRAGYVYPSWSPNNQVVAYYTKGVDFDRQELFFVGLNGENFKSTIVEGRGVQAKWSENGDNLLYSAYHARDDYKPKLWVVGASGNNIGSNRQSLDINTWAEKCTFASEGSLYCAVPENMEEGAGMFPELADQSKDNLYKIDLNTGAKTLIAVPDGAYNVSDIIVPEDESQLYFTDKSSEMIYQINLR